MTKVPRAIKITALAIVSALAAAALVAVVGNSYAFDERSVAIPTPQGTLSGVVTTPRGEPAQGLVVMIHGDGPVTATQDGLYAPWFDGAAQSGYATISWSKAGVGGSAGDWLQQSLADRAAEAEAVIDWARAEAELPTSTIVLWGASQAGWVLPSIVADRDDIDGVVAVGTAVNWLRQGRFNLEAELRHSNASAATRARAVAASEHTDALLERGASYSEYAATTTDADRMTEERWGFVERNFRADATAELRRASKRDVPWVLLAGVHDHNVDVAETAQVYREVLGDRVTVVSVNAVHSMARPAVDDSEFLGAATAVFWPRALLADGVIDAYRGLLDRVARR